jgi:4-alpha-glucanotransferase
MPAAAGPGDARCSLQPLTPELLLAQVYANAKGIKIIGDMPIYVGGQSADVWANRHLFELNEETCAPDNVSGVPPDAFSATGQLWGSPLYRWGASD